MPNLVGFVLSAVASELTESEDGYSNTCVKLSLKVIFLCKKIEYDHYKKKLPELGSHWLILVKKIMML